MRTIKVNEITVAGLIDILQSLPPEYAVKLFNTDIHQEFDLDGIDVHDDLREVWL